MAFPLCGDRSPTKPPRCARHPIQWALTFCPVVAVFVFIGTIASVTAAQATKTVTIPDEIACKECAIVRQHVVRVGRPTDSVLLGRLSVVARSPRGYFVVAPTATRFQAAVYDSSGVLLRTLGRRGQGPGEFTQISRPVIGPADTVFIFELDGRYSVYTPELQFIETRRLPVRPDEILMLPTGEMVIGAVVGSALGYPLHLVGREAGLVRSFGTTNPVYRADRVAEQRRQIGLAGTGADMIWSGRSTRYDIELWGVRAPRPQLVMTRNAPWFGEWSEPEGAFNTHRPPTTVADVRGSSDGRLWVRLSVADRAWAPDPSIGQAIATVGVGNRFKDSVLEVLDVRAGRVLARQRFDEGYHVFIPSTDLMYTLTETDQGFVVADIWRVSLHTP